jgi:hypothetical protein
LIQALILSEITAQVLRSTAFAYPKSVTNSKEI